MLRPERMARVSVTGSKRVMDDVIETVHDLDVLHVTEYDGSFDGFEPGDPIEGADEASDKLVTVRSLESILDVDDEDAGPTRLVTDDALEAELEEIRVDVNELDDRRDELRDELRSVAERIDSMEPFVRLGIDLELLRGYDSLAVAVGEAEAAAVERTLAESDIDTFEVFGDEAVAAAFARADEDALQDALVGTTFTELEVPEGEGDPETYLEELRHRKQQLESKLSTVEDELEDLKLDVAGFLLAAEETLTIDVQKREAPLTFATTENAFVAEGWLPDARFEELRQTLQAEVGEALDVTKLEVAEYDEDGHVESTEPVGGHEGDGDDEAIEAPAATDEGEPGEAVADGGHASGRGFVPIGSGDPPVVQDNPGPVKPFESLVEVINRPKYSELDPTVTLFLTFPVFFGFMIGDLGYGILYMGIGYWIIKSFDSDVMKSLGGVGLWAGAFTAIFGVLYGEFFGLHKLGDLVWAGHPPIHKGLQPHYVDYAYAWLLLSAIVGTAHLVLGRLFDFVNNLHHGVVDAVLESGSWIMLTVGLWVWVFSTHVPGPKPDFMFEVFASGGAIPVGFAGFSPTVGLAGLAVGGLGLVLVAIAEGPFIALIESITQGFGHVVSYTRIAAVLLAKAGMALAVNLLVFGAYSHDGEFHFIFFDGMPEHAEDVIFSGLVNADGPVTLLVGALFGLVILVLGHLLVLVLGITSAGLQAIRLEYVEFFGKFYEGGGTAYTPFGHERTYTTDE